MRVSSGLRSIAEFLVWSETEEILKVHACGTDEHGRAFVAHFYATTQAEWDVRLAELLGTARITGGFQIIPNDGWRCKNCWQHPATPSVILGKWINRKFVKSAP